MNQTAIVNGYTHNYTQTQTVTSNKASKVTKSFQTQMADAAKKKTYPNAVADYKKKHPEHAGLVDSQVRSGKKVLEKNGAADIDRDSMTMEEYKQFFTNMMDSIPYDISQSRDVNVWTISEKGWEQMKNDPDYEAWVLGYTAQDRAVHNPWASMPGYAPHYHTERFGATINEHLGQSMPMSSPTSQTSKEDGISWWVKRHNAMKKATKEQEAKSYRETIAKRQAEQRRMMQANYGRSIQMQQFLNPGFMNSQKNMSMGMNRGFDSGIGQIMQAYESMMRFF